MPGDPCGSELAHEEAGVSGDDLATGSQSLRASSLPRICVWPESLGMPGDQCGSELAHEEARVSGGDLAAGSRSCEQARSHGICV